MSRDAAHRLLSQMPERPSDILKKYSVQKDPKAVFHRIQDPERVRRLAGERIYSYMVMETNAVVFFPSVYSQAALDL